MGSAAVGVKKSGIVDGSSKRKLGKNKLVSKIE
jgi:hypothetical protein